MGDVHVRDLHAVGASAGGADAPTRPTASMSPELEADFLEAVTRVEPRRVGEADVVRLSGVFDLHAAGELEDALEAARARSRLVVLDLSEVRFFDSTALGLVLALRRRLLTVGGRLALVVDGPEARRVFQISGLDRVFCLAGTVDAAVALVSDGGR